MKHDPEFMQLVDNIGELAAEQMLVEIFDASAKLNRYEHVVIYAVDYANKVIDYIEYKICINGNYMLGEANYMFAVYCETDGQPKIENSIVNVWIDINKTVDEP